MPRKRAPGAGRKPKGEFKGKASTFSTRITPETRRALEDAARRSKRSVSQEAEYLLRTRLQKPTGELHNRALAHAIALLAANIEQDAGQTWQTDPFAGMALLHGVEAVVLRLIPVAENPLDVPAPVEAEAAKMPPEFAERFRTPAGFGHTLAYRLMMEIEGASPTRSPPDEWSMPIFFSADASTLSRLNADLGLSRRKKGRSA